jgi:hypothetical protein
VIVAGIVEKVNTILDGVVKICHLLRCHKISIIVTYFSTPK